VSGDDERFDVAVLGAGCAGLAMGVEFIKVMGAGRRLLLVDSRSSYKNDRTWCSWGVKRHGFERAVAYIWPRCLVRYQGRTLVIAPRRYRYHCVPGKAYYDLSLERLRGRAELALSEEVRSVSEKGNDLLIRTSRRTFLAHRVVDARWDMDSETPPAGGLMQEFLGQKIRAEIPAFDPKTATLMDFDVPQDHGVHFCYVLPFSKREALVEPTLMGRRQLPAEEYRKRIAVYLDGRFGVRHYKVIAEESGRIPMGWPIPSRADRNARIVASGTKGGLIKASSGFGFHAIQQHAKALAEAWSRDHWGAHPFPRSRMSRLLDTIFLGSLRDNPRQAPSVFFRLFERVDADRLARFLSDAAKPVDYGAIMRAVPMVPMLRQLIKLPVSGNWGKWHGRA
jgi:lycopene beta-cyclase